LFFFGPVAEENLPQPGQFYMFYKEYVKKPFSVAFLKENRLFFIIKKLGPSLVVFLMKSGLRALTESLSLPW